MHAKRKDDVHIRFLKRVGLVLDDVEQLLVLTPIFVVGITGYYYIIDTIFDVGIVLVPKTSVGWQC